MKDRHPLRLSLHAERTCYTTFSPEFRWSNFRQGFCRGVSLRFGLLADIISPDRAQVRFRSQVLQCYRRNPRARGAKTTNGSDSIFAKCADANFVPEDSGSSGFLPSTSPGRHSADIAAAPQPNAGAPSNVASFPAIRIRGAPERRASAVGGPMLFSAKGTTGL